MSKITNDGENNGKKYSVGYGRPPIDSQFKKGQSGNPSGRKKKALPKTIFEALYCQLTNKVHITNELGVKEKICLFEILARQLVNDAIKKDGQSRKFLLEHLFKVDIVNLRTLYEKKDDVSFSLSSEESKQKDEIIKQITELIEKNKN